MKYSLSTTLVLLSLVAAGSAQLGDNGNGKLPVARATVSYVAPTSHHGPNRVEILGNGLDLITGARVNGGAVPILANDGHRMVIDAPNQPPGFGVLELAQPDGIAVTETIEFTPSLAGHWNHQWIQLRVHAAAGNTYQVYYSFRTLREPLLQQGIHNPLMLDMTTPYSGELFGGLIQSSEPVLLPWMPVPRSVATYGGLGAQRPMQVQALCIRGPNLCYSNLLTLAPRL